VPLGDRSADAHHHYRLARPDLGKEPGEVATGGVVGIRFVISAGANPDNQALTTGLGENPVRFPLHIDSWVTGQAAPRGITVYGISDPAENYGFDGWAHSWFLQKMVPASRAWPAHESYWDIYTVPSGNEFTIHQTIIPTAFYWGFLSAREATPGR
jgi:endoglucanase